jgi:hypothetical protein
MKKLIARVTIIAVGINNYQDRYLPKLKGAHKDVEKLRLILTTDKKTALYSQKQFIELKDPDSNEFRNTINNYILSRSADRDILILYFSGHGVAIGRDDFGLCTTDTIIHPLTKTALPLSVVKISEILHSLNTANIIPVIIIDACYSGIAGKRLKIPPIEAISTIQNQIHTVAASSYALLCSCSELELSIDTPDGGLFSENLSGTIMNGIKRTKEFNSPTLTLHNISNEVYENILSTNTDVVPRIYIGYTLPEFPISLNTKYKMKSVAISPSYVSIIEALWNNGNERALSPEEIRELCGNGAYGNHNKLSYEPWKLVETIPNSHNRRLTRRGKSFIQNNLKIPKKIIEDPKTGKMIPAKDTQLVDYSFFSKR